MKFKPLVSIIIPVYNGELYVREAIDSALSQTYSNVEVIVVNDGSTDSTESIALSYGSKIRYFRKNNGGVSSALNLGIAHMNGEYFSWLSHDDKYYPEKIEYEINALISHNSKQTIVLCGSEEINENSQKIKSIHRSARFKSDTEIDHREVLMSILRQGSLLGCALLIPRNAIINCGGFDENLRFCQDLLMWEKVFLEGYSLIQISEVLVSIRMHNGQLTHNGRELIRIERTRISQEMAHSFAIASDNRYNFILAAASRDAIYNNKDAVWVYIKEGRPFGLVSFSNIIQLRLRSIYGTVRPWLRKIYNRIFRKIGGS